MICLPCRAREHRNCAGTGQCPCQHRTTRTTTEEEK